MNLSTQLTARKDYIERQNGELPNDTFSVSSYFDSASSSVLGCAPVQHALFESIRQQRLRQASLLVEAGVDIDSKNEKGQSFLTCSCIMIEDSKHRTRFVQLFLEAGTDPNIQDRSGTTALMYATVLGQMDVIFLLLDHPKININIEDQRGNTALLHACKKMNQAIVLILLNAHMQLNGSVNSALAHKNIDEKTASDIAAEYSSKEIKNIINIANNSPDRLNDVSIEISTSNTPYELEHGLCKSIDVNVSETRNGCALPSILNNGMSNHSSADLMGKASRNPHAKVNPSTQITIFPFLFRSIEKIPFKNFELNNVSSSETGTCFSKINPNGKKQNSFRSVRSHQLSVKSLKSASSGEQCENLPPIKSNLIDYETVIKTLKKQT